MSQPNLTPNRNAGLSGGLLPSVFDRLVGYGPESDRDRHWYSINQMLDVVRRDVQNLLNTRQTHQGLFDGLPEVQNSFLTYGLPDPSSYSVATPQQRLAVAKRVATVITKFEPRLSDVRVVVHSPDHESSLRVQLRIEAKLAIEEAPDVIFETTLEMITGRYHVEQQSD